ncbi:MAG: hypothetical protein POELPBGB_02310 [Bacteroidia bacterium]|nr:hypothetical protein [Bacteroidia bacterium]
MEKPLVSKKFLLEKYPGKGGWTFARLPDIRPDKKSPFGWRKVRGTIDGFEIRKYHLMPMGNGDLFLPVKAEIRKAIKKHEGDYVHIVLFPDNEPMEVPEEMLLCLNDEPDALRFFNALTESEQRYYINWIYSAKKEETKIDRLAKAINRLLKKEKFYLVKDE